MTTGYKIKEKIPVIYILSNGRSGSTLLDLLLGGHPSMWTLGEAQLLPWAIRGYGLHCGCGQAVPDCRFWATILPDLQIDQSPYPINHFWESPGGGKALRMKELFHLFSGMNDQQRTLAIAAYGKLNAEYFLRVWQEAMAVRNGPIEWLIDASKDPYRLWWLYQSGQFDFRVIHLVKDPRAFVYSMTRQTPLGVRAGKIRMLVRWMVTNVLFSYLCWRMFDPAQVYWLRYEELAEYPDKTLARLGSWLDLSFPDDLAQKFRHYPNHAVAGNPMRWQQTKIALDERWRTELSPATARAIKMLTWPLAWLYGYR